MSESREARATQAATVPFDHPGSTDFAAVDLTPIERAQLNQIARTGSRQARRRARIVLARADGWSLKTIARREGLHRDSVRRSLLRFAQYGVAGLPHGNTGQANNCIFTPSERQEIHRRARLAPRLLGESFSTWSLYKLRDHLIRTGVVESISVERLRQLVAPERKQCEHWDRRRLLTTQLPAAHHSELHDLTEGEDAADTEWPGRGAPQAPRAERPSNLRRWLEPAGEAADVRAPSLPNPALQSARKP
jgi:transposase